MSNEKLKKFAEELKTAREEKGISIKDIHANTKIDIKFLEALENGNYSVLPEVYIRAFIREFANEVDLDVEETLKKYDLAKEGVDFTQQEEAKEESTNEKTFTSKEKNFGEELKSEQTPPKKKQNMVVIYSAIGILALAVILILIFSSSGNDEIIVENQYRPQTAHVESNTKETMTQENPPSATIKNKHANVKNQERKRVEESQTTTTVNQNQQYPVNPFSLKLMGTDTVWVRAQIDFDKTEEFTLYPEIGRTIQADRAVNLLIGNSGGVEIFIDGTKIDFIGEKGKVKNLILTKNGIQKP